MLKKMLVFFMCLFILILSTDKMEVKSETENESYVQEIADAATAILYKGFGEYYVFYETEVHSVRNETVEGFVETELFLEIDAMLKANDITELDCYKGMNAARTNRAVMRTDITLQQDTFVCNKMGQCISEAAKYIGVHQPLCFAIKVIHDVDNNEREFLVEDGLEYVPIEKIYPATHEELYQRGYNLVTDLYEQAAEVATFAVRNSFSYNNATAVNYAVTYTSNPTGCNLHDYECGHYIDTTKYNPEYTHYAERNVDCANYVSQILAAGGLVPDDTWNPTSTTWTWTSVSKLSDYMLSEGYWITVERTEITVGDFMRYLYDSDGNKMSHIVVISSYDMVTFKYSGHTRDRLNCPFTADSNKVFYRINYAGMN